MILIDSQGAHRLIASSSILPKSRSTMRLNPQLVKKFQTLHHEKYGEEISYETAELRLNELADLVRITSSK